MNIDWNSAPAWANEFGAINGGSYAWLSEDGYCFHGIKNPPCHPYRLNDYSRDMFTIVSRRPWSGEGLPPVGTICEFQGEISACPSDPWRKGLHDGVQCRVIAHFKSKSWDQVAFTFVDPDGNTEVEKALPDALRPIRTAEQIAAEERARVVAQMQNDASHHANKDVFEKLYLAGYRKQPPK